MDGQRMHILYEHADAMGSVLLGMLDQFKRFSEQTVPTAAVLCTDKQLRTEADRLFTVRGDMTVRTFVTETGISEEDIYGAMLSDAVIVCTRAKTLAPESLYELMQKLSDIGKQTFVIVAGWNGLIRTKEMAHQRIEKVRKAFDFARIVEIVNVYESPQEGFVRFEEAADRIADSISARWRQLHMEQEENLYGYVKKQVRAFYQRSRIKIRETLERINSAETVVMYKEASYLVSFGNLAVNLQDVAEEVGEAAKGISYGMFCEEETGDFIEDIFNRSGVQAQKFAKKYLLEELQKRLDRCRKRSDEKIQLAIRGRISECMREMQGICERMYGLPFLPRESLDRLCAACQNKDPLQQIAERYDAIPEKLIDDVAERIPAKVREYAYELTIPVKVRDSAKEVLEKLRRKYLDEEESDETGTKEHTDGTEEGQPEQTGEESAEAKTPESALEQVGEEAQNRKETSGEDEGMNEASRMLEAFREDIKGLIAYSQTACVSIAWKCADSIRKDIEEFTKRELKCYFGGIISEMEAMEAAMNDLLSAYSLEV